MKKLLILLLGIALLVFLPCCSKINKQNFYGVYTFKKICYLSPLSSSTIDYINQQSAGTKYTITSDLFKIGSSNNNFEIKSPKYVKEALQKKSGELPDIRTIIGKDVKFQYTIYDKYNNKTNWRLYVSSDCLWLASVMSNATSNSETIMDIIKLTK